MSPSPNYIPLLLFTTLLLPLHTIARDSEFFSKVTHFNKETQIPNKEESTTPATNKPEDQQPSFIPQTENSYGLYGHEPDHLPTTTAATNSEFENNNKYYNNDAYNTKFYNKDPFANNQNELSDTKYNEQQGYMNYNSMMEKQNNNERPFHNNNNNNYYNVEKQGMSDTRFLEGGKYFHDIYSEKYNPTMYGDSSSRGVNTNNWYHHTGNSYNSDNNGNNNGYNNGYNNNGYYQNNNHGSYNGYKNHVNQFEDEQNEFEP